MECKSVNIFRVYLSKKKYGVRNILFVRFIDL